MKQKEGDQTFTLFWLTGQRQVVHGRDIAEAMTLAGYSNGALRALDFYAEGDNHEYRWVPDERDWKRISTVAALTAEMRSDPK